MCYCNACNNRDKTASCRLRITDSDKSRFVSDRTSWYRCAAISSCVFNSRFSPARTFAWSFSFSNCIFFLHRDLLADSRFSIRRFRCFSSGDDERVVVSEETDKSCQSSVLLKSYSSTTAAASSNIIFNYVNGFCFVREIKRGKKGGKRGVERSCIYGGRRVDMSLVGSAQDLTFKSKCTLLHKK